jgi:hypothetical protein
VYTVFEKNPEFYARLIHDENLPVIEFAIRKWKELPISATPR